MTAQTTDVRVVRRAAVAPRRARRRFGITRERLFAVLSPLLILVLWQVLSDLGVIDERVFSTPIDVVRLAGTMFAEGDLWHDVLVTVQRLILGMLAGAVPGTLLGLWMGLSRTARAVVDPIVAATYPLPRIALFPLVLFVVGLNETSLIVMVALGPFFTMLISTMTAVTGVPKIYLRVAKSFGAGRLRTNASVVLPAALPVIMSGVQISMGLALLGVVSAEFLVGQDGLGYVIWHAWTILSLPESMVGLVLAGLVGFVAYMLVAALEPLLMPYKSTKRSRKARKAALTT